LEHSLVLETKKSVVPVSNKDVVLEVKEKEVEEVEEVEEEEEEEEEEEVEEENSDDGGNMGKDDKKHRTANKEQGISASLALSVPYVSRTDAEVIQFMYSMCHRFAEIIYPTEQDGSNLQDQIFVHLDQHNWDFNDAVCQWTALTDATVGRTQQRQNKLPVIGWSDVVNNDTEEKKNASSFSCMICSETIDCCQLLNCQHVCCKDCWSSYVAHDLRENGYTNSNTRPGLLLSCPHHSCNTALSIQDWSELGNVNLQTIQKRVVQKFTNVTKYRRSIRGCPSPNCSEWVCWNETSPSQPSQPFQPLQQHRPAKGTFCSVRCKFNHAFCFSCLSNTLHGCASCEAWSKFNLQRNQDDALLVRWLMEHTKLCPKHGCKERLEKAAGSCT
jgi:hypothetical protein